MENNGNGKKTEHRITALEIKVDAILKNHLPHIQTAIDKVKEQLDSQKTWLVSLMGGVIVSLLLLIINIFK